MCLVDCGELNDLSENELFSTYNFVSHMVVIGLDSIKFDSFNVDPVL